MVFKNNLLPPPSVDNAILKDWRARHKQHFDEFRVGLLGSYFMTPGNRCLAITKGAIWFGTVEQAVENGAIGAEIVAMPEGTDISDLLMALRHGALDYITAIHRGICAISLDDIDPRAKEQFARSIAGDTRTLTMLLRRCFEIDSLVGTSEPVVPPLKGRLSPAINDRRFSDWLMDGDRLAFFHAFGGSLSSPTAKAVFHEHERVCVEVRPKVLQLAAMPDAAVDFDDEDGGVRIEIPRTTPKVVEMAYYNCLGMNYIVSAHYAVTAMAGATDTSVFERLTSGLYADCRSFRHVVMQAMKI